MLQYKPKRPSKERGVIKWAARSLAERGYYITTEQDNVGGVWYLVFAAGMPPEPRLDQVRYSRYGLEDAIIALKRADEAERKKKRR